MNSRKAYNLIAQEHIQTIPFPLPWTRPSSAPPSVWEASVSSRFSSFSDITPTSSPSALSPHKKPTHLNMNRCGFLQLQVFVYSSRIAQKNRPCTNSEVAASMSPPQFTSLKELTSITSAPLRTLEREEGSTSLFIPVPAKTSNCDYCAVDMGFVLLTVTTALWILVSRCNE